MVNFLKNFDCSSLQATIRKFFAPFQNAYASLNEPSKSHTSNESPIKMIMSNPCPRTNSFYKLNLIG